MSRWKVTYDDKARWDATITVDAKDDVEAGKKARAILGVKRMPAGTMYTKVSA